MEIKLFGESSNTVQVDDNVFNCCYNQTLIHQVVTAYLAKSRAGTHAQKTRSQVRGGGAKPWRQKGTGRARAGTIRSPLWRGGGVTFAASNRDYSQKVNKKMYKQALRSILSELLRQERLQLMEDISCEQPKTSALVKYLAELNIKDALIIVTEVSENLHLSARNIPNIEVCSASKVDPAKLMTYSKVLITADALKKIEGRLV